jgi:hypothetical protein
MFPSIKAVKEWHGYNSISECRIVSVDAWSIIGGHYGIPRRCDLYIVIREKKAARHFVPSG